MSDQTDRELLELAAKAAGVGPLKSEKYSLGGARYYYRQDDFPSGTDWNPLTDDGDALRLAVKLGIDLTLHGAVFSLPYAIAEIDPSYGIYGDCYFTDDAPDADPYASTRRAIVRAAAAIAQNGATK